MTAAAHCSCWGGLGLNLHRGGQRGGAGDGSPAAHAPLCRRQLGPVVKAWERGGVSCVRGASAHGHVHGGHASAAAAGGGGGGGEAQHHHRHGWSLFPLFRFSRHRETPEGEAAGKYEVAADEGRQHGRGSWAESSSGGVRGGGEPPPRPKAMSMRLPPRPPAAGGAGSGGGAASRQAGGGAPVSRHWWEV